MEIIASKGQTSMNSILYNALVYPQYKTFRRPTAVVISKNRIAAVGHDYQALRRDFPRHEPIDMKGRVLLPGFVDSHTHFFFWARTINAVHLENKISFEGCLKEIEKKASMLGKDDWVIGDGWAIDRWMERHTPTATELDSVTGDRPAALFSKDQHMLWANTRALKLAGITAKTKQPDGGKIEKDPATGEPTGILKEMPAYFPVIKLISRPRPEQVEKNWKKVARTAYSRGVTGFHSMDGPEGFDFFAKMHDKRQLGFRAHYYYPVKMLDELIERGVQSGQGDDTLRVGGIKHFADGSLGAKTANMITPYRGSKDNYGVAVTSLAKLKQDVIKAARRGLASAIHAIGDKAVENVITAFEAGYTINPELRQRVEHLQIIAPKDIKRLKKYGIIASMQPSHCPADRKIVAEYWGSRGKNAYIFKTLIDKGIPLAFGSDGPIEPIDPLAGISAAVNRTGYGERGGRFYPEQALTVAQAVYGFTAGAAYAAGREEFSGKIAPGYQADLVILEDNIFTMPRSNLHQARVAATIYNGKQVYRLPESRLSL